MSNIEDVRKKNLLQRYKDKVDTISTYGELNINDPSLTTYVSKEVEKRDDFSSLINSIYHTPGDLWNAAGEMIGVPEYIINGGGHGSSAVSMDVRKESGVTASKLNSVLGGKLSGHGDTFIRYGKEYGIDPAFLAAVSMHETGNGTSDGIHQKNNVGGMMMENPETGEYNLLRTYSSVDDGIRAMASNLKRNYIDQGLISVEAIQRKYAPVGASNDPDGLNANWVGGVKKYMNQMGINNQAPSGTAGTSALSVAIQPSTRPVQSDYTKIISALTRDMNTYAATGKIPLPSTSYNQCFDENLVLANRFTVNDKHIYGNIFTGSSKNKFIQNTSYKYAGCLRKDMIYYLSMLQVKCKNKLGLETLTINSGFRDANYNSSKEVGGASNSMHVAAIAVDIKAFQSYDMAIDIANIAYEMGFGCIYIGKQTNYFVHLDIGPYRRYQHSSREVGKYISPTQTGRG
jgi:hypothetical protein